TLHDECLDKIVAEVFIRTSAEKKIAQKLSYEDLKNMATIKVMAQAANFELNRRSRVLHYRDGEINPPTQLVAILCYFVWPSTTVKYNERRGILLCGDNYVPKRIPRNKIRNEKVPIDRAEIKGDPMNGVFFPCIWEWNYNIHFSDMKALMFKYGRYNHKDQPS
uniref:Uncharacterized protein n=1 Tax=Onchocerca volvulus TaxID=6282 RepID=A0A8R1XTG3_ONCVO